jgi:hypothetical protein
MGGWVGDYIGSSDRWRFDVPVFAGWHCVVETPFKSEKGSKAAAVSQFLGKSMNMTEYATIPSL